MTRSLLTALALSLSLTALAAPSTSAIPAAAAATVAAEFPASIMLAGRALALNGSGSRHSLTHRIYDVALYAPAPARSVEDLLSQEGPKALRLLLRRDMPATEFGQMMLRGIADANPRDDVMRQLVGVSQVGGMFGSRNQLQAGDSFTFQYLPGVGTVLLVNDKVVGDVVRDRGFYALMMRVWLGRQPVDERLKAALLGLPQPAAVAVNQH